MDYEGATRRDIKAEKNLMDIYRRQLEELPAGRLTSKRISGKTYYYKVRPGGKRQEYISVDNAQLVAALKDRRYAEEAMKILQENVKAQEAMLKKYRRYSPKDIFAKLGKAYQPEADKKVPTAGIAANGYRREGMIHRTTFGLMVRSKSEALIAEILRGYELDFRYEEALHLFDKNGNETIRYPDFTIYLKNGTVVYWEHMGMLGDEIYRNAAFGKLELYYYNGILPGANLMITCDDNEGAMDVGAVSRIAASLEV
ncbi:MAG: hypothetical protein ACLU7V_07485 [Anaerovoracaceae bacterium]